MGLDEAYADLTGVPKPLRVLRELVDEVREKTGVTISVGVGPSRLVAKCCSDHGKPAGLVAMGREEACERFATAPTSRVPGIGPEDRRAARRARADARSASSSAPTRAGSPPASAARTAAFLKARAEFRDDSPVETESRRRRSRYSSETTFDEDISDLAELEAVVRRMRRELCEGLAKKGRRGRTIGIKVRLADWTNATRARSIEAPTNDVEAGHRDRARAAARLRAAEAGAAARRADRVLRGRRRAAAPAGAAGRGPARARRSSTARRRACGATRAPRGARPRARRARRRRSGAGRRAGRGPRSTGSRRSAPSSPRSTSPCVERGERVRAAPASSSSRRRAASPSAANEPVTSASSSSASSRSPRAASRRASGTAASARPGSSSSARRRSASPPLCDQLVGLGGHERVEEALDLRAGLGAHELGDDLAVAVGLHGRDALDPVLGATRAGWRPCRPWPARPCPSRLVTAFSRIGVSWRQGPHQAAQKSTTTGSSRERSTTSAGRSRRWRRRSRLRV